MTKLLPLAAAVSLAVPAMAHAQAWDVTTAEGSCRMSQTFQHPEFGRGTLAVDYNPARQAITLTSINATAEAMPDTGEVRWAIVFLDNGEVAFDDGWSVRAFSYTRDDDRYRFSTSLAGRNNVRQFLADLAASRAIGFMREGKLVTAYELDRADASIARLRDCTAGEIASN